MENNEEKLQEPSKEDLDNFQQEQWKKKLYDPQYRNRLDVKNAQDFHSLKAKNNLLGSEEYDTSTVDKIQEGAGKVADYAYDFLKYSMFPGGTGIYDRALIAAGSRLGGAFPGAGILRLVGAHYPDLDAKEETSKARKKACILKGIFGIEQASDGLYYFQDRLIEGQEKKILMKLFPQYEEQLKKMSPEGIRTFARMHQKEIEEVLKNQYPELIKREIFYGR